MERANNKSRTDSDFISSLPDPILHHILGLLKTKEAVQTCVLSKRWEHLWTFLPSLNFNSADFYARRQLKEVKNDDQWFDWLDACWERFVEFVNMVLLRRKSLDLDMFFMYCGFKIFSDDEQQVRDWIHYAVKHKTRVLKLKCNLPCCIYPWTSLEELHVYRCEGFGSGTVTLPKLRKLFISDGQLESDHLKNLLSASPLLEYLSLDNSIPRECVIAHGCLKHLDIVYHSIKRCNLHISAPNLISFSYDGGSSSVNKTLNMPSLMFARLVSRDLSTIECLAGMITMLSFLTTIEQLELHVKCDWQKEFPAVLRTKLPIFHKLKELIVGFSTCSCFQMVTWILRSSPNLKKLTLLEQEASLDYDERSAITSVSTNASSRVAISSCKNLEIIEVKYEIFNQMIGRSAYALIDGTEDNWYTLIKKYTF